MVPVFKREKMTKPSTPINTVVTMSSTIVRPERA
jgi:hypothetical protein